MGTYDTWLLDFIDTEMANGVFDRVGEFVMTIAMVNPPLANQLVPRVLDRASLLDVDSVAKSMVKGGALDLERDCPPRSSTSMPMSSMTA